MARATRLRIHSERPADEDGGDEPVIARFPVVPPPVAPNSQLGDDVLAILRRDTALAVQQADHADSTASQALLTAQRTDTTVHETATALERRAAEIEVRTAEIGKQAMAAIAESQRSTTRATTVLATAINHLVALLAHIVAYLLDRAPALLALGAAVWLWQQVLEDPTVLRLIGLGLFGALVIAPALWLSARGKGAGNAQ